VATTNAAGKGSSTHVSASTALLGDTPLRNYSAKLQLFNAFAQPEIRRAIASLGLHAGMRVLDAGCGTGETLDGFLDVVGDYGLVVGMDLAAAHTTAARRAASSDTLILQADLLNAPLRNATFDLIWCVNTLGHLRDPVRGLDALVSLIRADGRIALGQSSFMPDMFFAWDARLERVTNEAVRQYYRHRYGIDERELAAHRALVGLLRRAGLQDVTAHTFMIERVSPLSAADEGYLLQAIFRDTWGERLRPYLSSDDFEQLSRLCDPRHPEFALGRPDFHFLQTFTLVVGRAR
jgi:SAM-dependent methyltransferase